MKTQILYGALASLFFNLIAACGAQHSIGLDAKSFPEHKAVDENVLSVVQNLPGGELKASDFRREILVVFSHPIEPLGTLDKSARSVFQVEPPLKGKFRWYGSRVNAFIPENGYNPGVKYRVKVPAGFTGPEWFESGPVP